MSHRWGRRVAIAYCVLLSVVVIAIGKLQADQDSASNALKGNLIAACQRLNTLQVQDNLSHRADWKVFRVVLRESSAARVPASQARARALFLAPLRQAVAAKTWTPLLDCSRAVRRHGARYDLPTPVPFDVRLPPRSAVTP